MATALAAGVLGGSAFEAAAQPAFVWRVENHQFLEQDGLRAWRFSAPNGSSANGTAEWALFGASAVPGSARLTNSWVGSEARKGLLSQCVTGVVAGQAYLAGASWNAPSGQPLNANGAAAGVGLLFYPGPDCTPDFITGEISLSSFGPSGSAGWQSLSADFVAPAGSRSLRLSLELQREANQPAGAATVYFDDAAVIGPWRFVKGSFRNSGETDLLLRNTATGEHRVWFMNDEDRVGSASVSPAPGLAWQAAGVDDFDGDGRNDLLMWSPAQGFLDFWLLNETARVGSPVPIGGGDPGPAWKPSATADFNHDGQPDIVLRDPQTQQIRIWTMDGTTHAGTHTPTPSQAVDANWEIVGAADLDGDGNTDFLWYNWSSGRIVYWLMDANVVRTAGAFTNPMAAADANWKVLAIGDYGLGPNLPAPGRPATQDLVWRNATSGRLVVWFMDRLGNRTSGLFTDPPDLPAPASDWTVAGPR